MFQCVEECNQTLGGGPLKGYYCDGNWSMAFIVQMNGASFAYDLSPNVPGGWPYPNIPVYGSQPLGVYSAKPYVNLSYAMSFVGLWFEAGKYGCHAPKYAVTLSVNLYGVPENSTTTFWAFGYDANIVSLTQTMQPLRTSYFTIPPTDYPVTGHNATCGFAVPSNSNETCS